MVTIANCPPAEELQALSTGRLDDQQSDELLAHIRECGVCRTELETVSDGEDSLIASLRSLQDAAPFDEEPGCRVAVSKALGALALASEGAGGDALDFLPQVIGEYEIVRPLGRGGMGSVYLARHTKLGREVALKILAGHRLADPRTRERFEAEMRAVGRLSHPNIVTAHDAREIEGTAVLVTEYIDGFDLAQIVDRTGPLAVADASEIGRGVATALAYTSGQGFVHRDVKPSNIMLSRTGEVKLLDLGLARLQEGDLQAGVTGTGQTMGTADYIAPEQVSDSRSVDVRADIYSLGCTLFKLLSGAAPFADAEHATAFAKLTAHVSETPPSLADRAPGTPAALVKLVDSMLAKDPAQRPQTPQVIAEELAAFTRNADLEDVLGRAEAIGPANPRFVAPSTAPSANSEPALPLLRRKVPLPVAIAGGLLGLVLGLCLGLMLKIEYPDGTVVRVPVPPGSKVTLEEGASTRATDAQPGALSRESTPASTEFAPLQFAVLVEEDQLSAEQIEAARERLATAAGTWHPVAADVQVPVEATHRGTRYALVRHDVQGLIRWDEIRGQLSATNAAGSGPAWPTNLTFNFDDELAERVREVSGNNLRRQLALVVDNEIIAAPTITSELSRQARFTGTFSEEQIQYLMDALNGLVNVEPGRSSAATEPRPGVASGQMKELEGLWHLVSLRVGGKELGADNSTVWAFDQTKYWTATSQFVTGDGTYRLGEEGPHKTIDLYDNPRQEHGRIARGIYRLRPGGRMEIHSNQARDGDRPRSFHISEVEGPPESLVVYTFERLGSVPQTPGEAIAFIEGKDEELARAIMGVAKAVQVPPNSVPSPAAEEWDVAAKQDETRRRLRAIGVAFQKFYDTYGKFPGSASRTGAPPRYDGENIEPFSWRVAILPFLGEADLYEQYRFDEQWDSEHNRWLIDQMPDAYRSAYAPLFGRGSHYQGFVGPQTALGANGGVTLSDFTDGTSATLLIAETRSSVPWTKPQDIPFEKPEDAKNVRPFEGAPLNLVTADGAVHSMDPIDWEKLAALITRNGGEPVRP